MGSRGDKRAPDAAAKGASDFDKEWNMFDDDFDVDDEMELEFETGRKLPRKPVRAPDWRRVELAREKKMLDLALSEFSDYDYDFNDDFDFDSEYADDYDTSAYSH